MVKGKLVQNSKGWGVEATSLIKKGEIVEICPVVPILKNQPQDHVNQKQIARYAFKWNNECDAIVLGWGAVYNHDDQPNLEYKPSDSLTMVYSASRDILPGEELCISYGYHPLSFSWMETIALFFEKKTKKSLFSRLLK